MSVCVIGVGFRAGASAASIAEAVALALAVLGDSATPRAIATPADKAGAAALREAAAALALDIVAIDAEALARAAPDAPTRSATVEAHRGVACVCEAAALAGMRLAGAGSGAGARIAVSRVVSGDRMATGAIAVGVDQLCEERE